MPTKDSGIPGETQKSNTDCFSFVFLFFCFLFSLPSRHWFSKFLEIEFWYKSYGYGYFCILAWLLLLSTRTCVCLLKTCWESIRKQNEAFNGFSVERKYLMKSKKWMKSVHDSLRQQFASLQDILPKMSLKTKNCSAKRKTHLTSTGKFYIWPTMAKIHGWNK